MSAFEDLQNLELLPIWDGVVARAVEGEHLSLSVVELGPSSVVPEHSHPNEQLGLVVSGSLTFRVGDESRELGPGGTWRIPGNTPHEVHTGAEGAVVIDIFSPPREDWQALERGEPQAPLWP